MSILISLATRFNILKIVDSYDCQIMRLQNVQGDKVPSHNEKSHKK